MRLESLKAIDQADVQGKRVLLRADLNVPMAEGRVTDATRIERVLPTIKALVGRGAKVVVLSHFGRPKGVRKAELSLAPVARAMDGMLNGTGVRFVPDCVGDEARAGLDALAPGEVAVLENLRFHAGEETNDSAFAAELGALGDIFVNDAFSTAHRAHASTERLAHLLPAFAGLLMMAEVKAMRAALEAPERPVAAVVGGAKVSTKISVLTNLLARVDQMIIGGGMANTFLLAQGHEIGTSLAEPGLVGEARAIMARALETGCEIVLPIDAVAAEAFAAHAPHVVCNVGEVPADAMILDVGPATVRDLTARLAGLATLLWNGPLGAFELAPFGAGTFALGREAARLTKRGTLVTIAGGGDTVAALNAAGVTDDFTYVSTAGGAFLEWLEGRDLPGVVALTDS